MKKFLATVFLGFSFLFGNSQLPKLAQEAYYTLSPVSDAEIPKIIIEYSSRLNSLTFDDKNVTFENFPEFIKNNNSKVIQFCDSLISRFPKEGALFFSRAYYMYLDDKDNFSVGKFQSQITPRYDKIISDCNLAIANDFTNPEVNYLLFHLRFSYFQSQMNPLQDKKDSVYKLYQTALKDIQAAVRKNPESDRYLYAISLLHFHKLTGIIVISAMNDEKPSKILFPEKIQLEFLCSSLKKTSKDYKLIAFENFFIASLNASYLNDTIMAVKFLTYAINSIDKTKDTTLMNEFLFQRASLKFAFSDFTGAINDLTTIIARNNILNIKFYFLRGLSFFNIGNGKVAMADLTLAIDNLESKKSSKNKSSFWFIEYLSDDEAGLLYLTRGFLNINNNRKIQGCADFSEALNYGNKAAIEVIREVCNN